MRKPFIQSLGLLLAGVMLLAMAGCSALDNFISPSDWQAKGKGMLDNRKTISDSDVKQPERIDILIEALDKKDAAQFKSVFSETALELADDMDRGIEYIFGLYRGSYVKTVYQNYSSTKSYGEKNTVCVDSVYVIQTTESFYRICYTVWTVQEKNPRSVGIYSLFLEECEEDKRGAGGGSIFAGITYPEREAAEIAAAGIANTMIWGGGERLREVLSDELLAKPGMDAKIQAFAKEYSSINPSTVGDSWVRVSEDKVEGYYVANTKPRVCAYFFMSKEQPDKMGGMKVTLIREGKTFTDYQLKSDEIDLIFPESHM